MNPAVGQQTVNGELRWNIKQSFRDYVLDLPDGEETWRGSVGGVQEGDLVFASSGFAGREEAAPDGQTFAFSGGVRYSGYHGMLRVELSDPWVVIGREDTVAISVNTAPVGLPERRAVFATATGRPTESGGTWRLDIPCTALSAAGAAALGAVYAPGTEAAGFSVVIRRAPQ